jgi:hypothetical protein
MEGTQTLARLTQVAVGFTNAFLCVAARAATDARRFSRPLPLVSQGCARLT